MTSSDLLHKPLVLASTSAYRATLLKQTGLPFIQAAPDTDETPEINEAPDAYVLRLAEAKARSLVTRYPDQWIIGSDQTCVLDGQITGKPGNFENAVTQLTQASAKTVQFLTGLCLMNAQQKVCLTLCEPFSVVFRDLSLDEIEHYLLTEMPYDCAGSFRVEGLGIQLFKKLEGRDPNALIGLPLIGLFDLMREAGLNPLLAAGRS